MANSNSQIISSEHEVILKVFYADISEQVYVWIRGRDLSGVGDINHLMK